MKKNKQILSRIVFNQNKKKRKLFPVGNHIYYNILEVFTLDEYRIDDDQKLDPSINQIQIK